MGIVCGACDWLNSVESSECEDCGNKLALGREKRIIATTTEEPARGKEEVPAVIEDLPPSAAQEELEGKPMEQARHYICKSCYSPVPSGHKFCGKCGTPCEDNKAMEDPEYFGEMQVPGKAKLILIKGEGMDGISYHLNSIEHIAGRVEGAILFTEDKWLSPKHANFYYEDGKLMVRDEESVNGLFICLREPTEVEDGTVFLAGEQLFRVEKVRPFDDDPLDDGTYYFSSPRRESVFRVVQILEGGGEGMIVHARDNEIHIGREGGDMNFPNDPYLSGKHVKVELAGKSIKLVDLGSKNGTYVRLSSEREMIHGDYLFLGRQLLRVEITN